MKIGIIYATNRSVATVQVVVWLRSALKQKGIEVEVGKVDEFQNFDCGAFIIGSAVYGFSVGRAGIGRFLKQHQTHIQGKPVATFVVCGFLRLSNRYLRGLSKGLPAKPVAQVVFKGYDEEANKGDFDTQESKAKDWIEEVVEKVT